MIVNRMPLGKISNFDTAIMATPMQIQKIIIQIGHLPHFMLSAATEI